MSKKSIFLSSMFLVSMSFALGFFVAMNIGDKQIFNKDDVNKEVKVEDMQESTVALESIVTNLSNGSFAKMSFSILSNSPKTAEEVNKRMFQIENIITKKLTSMEKNELMSKEGLLGLENHIKEEINKLLSKGQVLEVYTTSNIVQ